MVIGKTRFYIFNRGGKLDVECHYNNIKAVRSVNKNIVLHSHFTYM